MKVQDIGGEFGLIARIAKRNKGFVEGIGDDCAIVKLGCKDYVITTDTLVEGDHFSLKWFSPKQVGMKAIEINASDVGAMGGKPKYALVSLVLPKDIEVETIDGIYAGMNFAAKKYGIKIIGGNITHGKQLVIDVDMFGLVEKDKLCKRSDAKPGDLIFVSGDLGGSTAGLELFRKKKKGHSYVKKKHTEPKAHFDKVKGFLKYINAMIDVSDGLAADVKHICEMSNVGAVIYADNVPIKDETRLAARAVGKKAIDYALFGGEDFELVYTVSENNIGKVKGFLIGEVTSKKGVRLYQKGKENIVKKHGYDHFLTKVTK